MVKETRIIFGLDDIKRFRIACGNPDCQYEMVFPLPGSWIDFQKCPYCKKNWVREEHGLKEFHILHDMQSILREKDRPVRLHFEIEAE